MQELVVTGSRIPSANLTSSSPVVTVTAQTIKLQGATNTEDIMANIPSAYIDYGAYESNGSTGTATADLRNLGSIRTLVLIDGKRVQPGDPTVPVPDLNFIPPGLIDRVEVLTGGASAVYGSDAMAGVVNFIMKKNFQGLQIDAETSFAETGSGNQQVRRANALGSSSSFLGLTPIQFPTGAVWDGQRYTVTITGGANSPDDKGNVEFYLGWTHIDPVDQGSRDYSKCSLATNNTNTQQQYCGGSTGTTANGRLLPLTGPNAGTTFTILGTPVNNTLPLFTNGQAFNYAPYNYFQRPDDRYTAGEFSNYEINKAIDLYSSFMFMNDETTAAIAPSGSFYGDNTYTIPCNDPLLTSAEANTLCGAAAGTPTSVTADIGRRNVEGGPRTATLEHTDYRIVFGAKGDLGQGWSYDVSAQYGQSNLTDIEGGYFLNSKLVNALDVVPGPNGPVCASGSPCVPYNIWTSGGVTQAALNYLTGEAISSGETTEQVVTGSVSGNLGQYGLKSPWASDGVGVSGGVEYRREFLETNYDATIQSGDLAGFGGSVKDTSGSQSDNDVFAEVRVPIVQNQPFFQNLTFDGGYRYSVYTSGGPNNTYKFALDWQTIPDVKIWASYERAVRAPNVQELFLPATPGLAAGTDPCAGSSPSFTPSECYNTYLHSIATGNAPNLSLAQFTQQIYGNIQQCPASQCGNFSGGNPNLTPETANTYDIGLVFTPTFFHGFTLTVDYYNIKVNQAILNIPFETIVNNCAKLDNSFDCGLINRFVGTNYGLFGGNGVGYVDQPLINAGSLYTNGIDVASTYRLPLSAVHLPSYGSLFFNFNGTWVDNLTTTLPDGTSYNCAGLYGVTCGTPTPHWRSSLRMTWNTPWAVTLSLNWRFISATSLDFNTNQADLQDGSYKDTLSTDAHIQSFNYFDLAGTWKIKDRYTLRAGINNIFDRTPPLLELEQLRHFGAALRERQHLPAGLRSVGPGVLPGSDRRLLAAGRPSEANLGQVRLPPELGLAQMLSAARGAVIHGACSVRRGSLASLTSDPFHALMAEFRSMASNPFVDTLSPDSHSRRLYDIAQAAAVDIQSAIPLALEAKADGVTDALVHHLVGLHLKEAGRLEEAVVELGLGLALEPENPGLMTTVGFCLLDAGRRGGGAGVRRRGPPGSVVR